MKVAIVHDYLHQFGGGEKVVEKWLQMYPDAVIYTAFFVPDQFKESPYFLSAQEEGRIKTSFLRYFLNNGVRAKNWFKKLFWLYPLAMKTVKVSGYDAVLISSVYCAKNANFKNNSRVVHYCHSPTRFLHGMKTETDHTRLPGYFKILLPFFKFWLKKLDLSAVSRLNEKGTLWLSNSKFIKGIIKKVYKTDSIVVYPPIELDNFLNIDRGSNNESFYYCHGRISSHKRIDLAIHACMKSGKKLKISGLSSNQWEKDYLLKIVKDYESENPSNKDQVTFLGRISDEQYHINLSKCRAFLFPGEEDFGIAPVEVLASGTPVIAYKSGGALEYIRDGENGVFFDKQSTSSLVAAIQRFEEIEGSFDSKTIKETSTQFSERVFQKRIDDIVRGKSIKTV